MDISKDCTFMIRQRLVQVCHGLYQIQLNFNDDLQIQVNDHMIYTDGVGSTREWKMPATKRSGNLTSFDPLLEQVVIKAYMEEQKHLILAFERDTLKIYSAGDEFESYMITYKDDFQVIY